MIPRKWFVLAPTAMLIIGTLAATNSGPKAACVVAGEWANEHVAELPQTYDAFAKFAPVYRRAIYQHLSPKVRQELWQHRLEQFVNDSSLSAEQRSFIATEIERLPVYMNGDAGVHVVKSEHRELAARALFGDSLARVIFATLVPNTPGSDVKAPDGKKFIDCNCQQGTVWSCLQGNCQYTPDCAPLKTGCGYLGCDACDGFCYY